MVTFTCITLFLATSLHYIWSTEKVNGSLQRAAQSCSLQGTVQKTWLIHDRYNTTGNVVKMLRYIQTGLAGVLSVWEHKINCLPPHPFKAGY